MVYTRKITKEGRVNIPRKVLNMFNLKEDDYVDVSFDNNHILIKKHVEMNICSVTGKQTNKLVQVGNAKFSEEGMTIIKELIR